MTNNLPNIHVPAGFELRRDENGKLYFAPKDLGFAKLATAHTHTAKTVKSSMTNEQKETLFEKEEMAAIEVRHEEKKGKKNANLHAAKDKKDDEFYTRIEDIDAELRYYKDFLKGKSIYCPCDKFIKDGRSMFVEYFCQKFFELGLKKVTISYFDENGHGHATYCDGDVDNNGVINADDFKDIEMAGNGSFDSYECKELMKQCDVVVTNPPFSLFRAFVEQILDLGKKFIIIGDKNALTFRDFFPLLKDGTVTIGYTQPKQFMRPDGSMTDNMGGKTYWFTNFDIDKRHQELPLCRTYYGNPKAEKDYPKYDNYNAIECGETKNIPMDYEGEIGVPITFLYKYSEDQFEIIGLDRYVEGNKYPNKRMFIDGNEIYARVIIRLKHPEKA